MMGNQFLSRAVTLTTLVTVLTLLFFGALSPLAGWRSAKLAEHAQTQARRAQLEDSIARLEAERVAFVSDDLAGLTWEGAQEAEATAKVQSAVNDMARNNGILMRSIAPTRDNNTEITNAIGFRLEFEASLDQLVPFLKTAEFSQPALVVTRASLRRLARPNRTGTQPDIFAQIDIVAPFSLTTERPE
ncbi:hypothetical protein DS901_02480 [Loktanella sp. D2R18]|uniref:type II secretion system protein GspM n=1 Tax=Rhodobacterales TaxID=204455 RepID=UPI000DEB64A0|nr:MULTISPECIES: type II secretion system protein GspM [Rhodobacterales]MDO6591944.1 type II secretion system protein GspM [Yoonia sp. 1_MG-2023]RBW45649.1 hypothetical protein DS901_02480 [Loktanella sp. D2R18]